MTQRAPQCLLEEDSNRISYAAPAHKNTASANTHIHNYRTASVPNSILCGEDVGNDSQTSGISLGLSQLAIAAEQVAATAATEFSFPEACHLLIRSSLNSLHRTHWHCLMRARISSAYGHLSELYVNLIEC